ncbi:MULTISPECIES: TetR/AcrR family transcriptional regulator [Streptomyces]|jgi:AcrR family transcriptional regulator|nr:MULTISPECIES: TetR/AcrR family transcriptional regulator [Streptomyces]MDX3088690.1 helix-turn-helix domain containing protein [Streptomyces sp. ME12-02E]MDX3331794.1 helix-turn-helix domain containing protein [Streptomyces sp. ME02-6978a]GHE58592.1 TetR family transcriptional regulator [Streptomyces griseoaurantiacus]
MARWEPNAAQRLATAALDLFDERGYDHTTVLDIAQRAGLAKSTFFRHFPDKRAVLFGEDTLTGPLLAALTAAPPAATPLEAVARGLDALGREVFTPERHLFVARRRAVIDAHPELQEREALKGLHLTAALTRALTDRGAPVLAAEVAAQLGALALKTAYERWSGTGGTGEFGALARQALDEVRDATTAL